MGHLDVRYWTLCKLGLTPIRASEARLPVCEPRARLRRRTGPPAASPTPQLHLCSAPTTFTAVFRVEVATTMSTETVCDGSRGLFMFAHGAARGCFATSGHTSAPTTLPLLDELVYATRLSVTSGRCFRPAR